MQQIQLGNQLDDVEQSNILEELRVQRARLESIFKQKSREVWLKDGGRNTKIFHTSTLVRRRRNKIVKIKAGKDWIQGKEEIKNYFLREFKELFSSDMHVIHDDLEGLAEQRILEEDNCALLRIPLKEEIKECVWNLHPLKSPGPDWFPGIFFRSYWEIVKEQVVSCIQECFRNKIVPRGLNRTFLVLIPKNDQASNFNHFRPISLCNFIYKICSKLLANRLRPLLDKIISSNQGAFVKGRWIAENSIIAQELVHKIKSHKGKNGLLLMKIDLKKAYDRLEWSFVDRSLSAWGFSEDF